MREQVLRELFKRWCNRPQGCGLVGEPTRVDGGRRRGILNDGWSGWGLQTWKSAIQQVWKPALRLAALRLAALWLGLAFWMTGVCAGAAEVGLPKAKISPDYAEVTIPPNIAPLNFKVLEPGTAYRVKVHGAQGKAIEIEGSSASVMIPIERWRTLLKANTGGDICVDISVKEAAGWKQFQTITNCVSHDAIDGYMAYRLIRPLYNVYSKVGIYQRDLSTFEQKPVLRNSAFKNGCVNCHTFLNHDPKTMAIHIRGEDSGNPMLLARSNGVAKIARTAGYINWHPSGRLVVYSVNKLSLIYHTTGETRDVNDAKSDLGVYRVDQNKVVVPPVIARPDRQETWPSWSADGKYLYFCSAPVMTVEHQKEIRYDLMRVPYDIETDTWGEAETLVSAAQTGMSCSQPRVSPDSRYVLCCMFKWGNFPIFQPNSELYLLDVTTRELKRLDINSPEAADTWHCWSTNGRWVVFSSKRRDGLFARPHFTWFDGKGKFTKPFILPQEDPEFYDSFTKTFNLPELIQEPVPYSEEALAEAVYNPKQVLTPTVETKGADQAPSVGESDSQADYRSRESKSRNK